MVATSSSPCLALLHAAKIDDTQCKIAQHMLAKLFAIVLPQQPLSLIASHLVVSTVNNQAKSRLNVRILMRYGSHNIAVEVPSLRSLCSTSHLAH